MSASTTATVAPPPIAFRPEPGGAAAPIGTSLLAAIALLAVTTVALAYAKRRGWLRRWTQVTGAAPVEVDALRVVHRLRLSPRTVVYELRAGERVFHVVESTARAVIRESR